MHNLASSYTIRKAVTRKHHLPVTIHQYIVKHEHSVLSSAIPKTFTFELAYPEDLDELWFDELYDLDCAFQQQPNKYWLLKAGMAEKGQSIRLFRSKEELQAIVDDFADDTSEDEEDAETPSQGDTKVSLSHMRMWVIQEYIDKPLLVSLEEGTPPNRKFHLRVYVLCVGAIQVYVYDQILALFAPGAYVFPPPRSHHDINAYDLSSHLTNTCLQDNDSRVSNKDQNVHRLSHLVGKPTSLGRELTAEDVEHIIQALTRTTGELFKAAVNSGSHFQVRRAVLPASDFASTRGSSDLRGGDSHSPTPLKFTEWTFSLTTT